MVRFGYYLDVDVFIWLWLCMFMYEVYAHKYPLIPVVNWKNIKIYAMEKFSSVLENSSPTSRCLWQGCIFELVCDQQHMIYCGSSIEYSLENTPWNVCSGWFCYVGRSVECLAGHHISCLSSIGQIDVKMFVVRAGWCPQLTNDNCEVLFIHKCVYQ